MNEVVIRRAETLMICLVDLTQYSRLLSPIFTQYTSIIITNTFQKQWWANLKSDLID